MEEDKVQVSVNIPRPLWDRLADDARGVGQAIVEALDAHLPHAVQPISLQALTATTVDPPSPAQAPEADQSASVPVDPAPGAN